MGPFFDQAKADGEMRADIALDDFIEWTLRIIFSFAMFDSPGERDKKSVEQLREAFLVPALAP